mmetsp:Transcript_95790/g.254366  ORF Transcript_95790/g.254366 Transcript_95790/m.254366 type:complete len:139 (-) Transcript_95790:347-763(-)
MEPSDGLRDTAGDCDEVGAAAGVPRLVTVLHGLRRRLGTLPKSAGSTPDSSDVEDCCPAEVKTPVERGLRRVRLLTRVPADPNAPPSWQSTQSWKERPARRQRQQKKKSASPARSTMKVAQRSQFILAGYKRDTLQVP